ncbi:hypothetical protein GQ54DRAFT_336457, partial [Martensiomyces pterosporus]
MAAPGSRVHSQSVLADLPNTVYCINPMELALGFHRFFYALPFYDGTKTTTRIIAGAYLLRILSMPDFHGWHRGTIFLHGPVPQYRHHTMATDIECSAVHIVDAGSEGKLYADDDSVHDEPVGNLEDESHFEMPLTKAGGSSGNDDDPETHPF